MPAGDQTTTRLLDLIGEALPNAIAVAFGGEADLITLNPGMLPDLLAEMDSAQHVHIEVEASFDRNHGKPFLFVFRPEDAIALFDLEPVDLSAPLDAETQMRLLDELTQGGEVLAGAFAGAVSSAARVATMRVSGASLEEAPFSAEAATSLVGADAIAATLIMIRPNGPLPVLVAVPAALAQRLAGGDPFDLSAIDAAFDDPAAAQFAAEPAPPAAGFGGAPMAGAYAAPGYGAPAMPQDPFAGAGFSGGAAGSFSPPGVTAHPVAFGQLEPPPSNGRNDRNIDPILDVMLHLRVELGSTEMTVEEVLALAVGSVIELDRLAGEPVDIVVNNRLLARGEVVVVEENFGVRLTEIVTQRQRVPQTV